MDLRDKDIAFFLDVDIPSRSEDDNEEEDMNNNLQGLLQNSEGIEMFHQEISETLDRWDAYEIENTSRNTEFVYVPSVSDTDVYSFGKYIEKVTIFVTSIYHSCIYKITKKFYHPTTTKQ